MADKETVRDIERNVLRIVRYLGRRSLGRAMERRLEGLVDFSHVALVDILAQGREQSESVTVGHIAKRADLDPSRASRMVAAAIRAGYARRVASQEDGRRTCVDLTEKGEEFAAAIRNMRYKFFAAQLKDWTEHDLKEFARLLAQFGRAGKQNESDVAGHTQAAATKGSVVVLHPRLTRTRRRRKRREHG